MTGTVLVVGGAGYVGSHCAKAFAERGWQVVVFDNLSRGWKDFCRWGELVEGDIRDSAVLDAAFKAVRPDAVAHFAALAYVGESNDDPGRYYETNVSGTINLLEAMRRAGTRKIVFSSTCATYGIPPSTPIIEETPQLPVNPYGRTKLMVEKILADYDSAYGIKAAVLRYFNAAGADAGGEIGERHEPETHAIPLLLEAAASQSQFTIFGNDYATADGTAVRDYIHVTDLARAHVMAMDHLFETDRSDIFNLGTGRGVSVKALIDVAEQVTGLKVPYVLGPRRAGDPDELVASPNKARDILGWTAVHSDIANILSDAWRWFSTENGREAR